MLVDRVGGVGDESGRERGCESRERFDVGHENVRRGDRVVARAIRVQERTVVGVDVDGRSFVIADETRVALLLAGGCRRVFSRACRLLVPVEFACRSPEKQGVRKCQTDQDQQATSSRGWPVS